MININQVLAEIDALIERKERMDLLDTEQTMWFLYLNTKEIPCLTDTIVGPPHLLGADQQCIVEQLVAEWVISNDAQ